MDKRDELLTDFAGLGCLTRTEIANRTGIPPNSLDRMLDGGTVTSSDNLRLLFGAFVPKTVTQGIDRAAREAKEQDRNQKIKAMTDKYFDTVKRKEPPAPAKPTALLRCMTIYIKFLHLRDRRFAAPVYHRTVRRTKKVFEVDVYDEALYLRTHDYVLPVKNKVIIGRRREGVIEALPIFPPRTTLVEHYVGKIGSPEVVEFIEATPSPLLQTSFLMFNGFQFSDDKEHDLVGSIIFEDCERFVLVLDTTSLPIEPEMQQYLFIEEPTAFHMRANQTGYDLLSMHYAKTFNGVYVLDSDMAGEGTGVWNPQTHSLLANDRIEFRFMLNWDMINGQA